MERTDLVLSKGIFITGTGTDIGKTYITALMIKTLRMHGYDVGYYKAAVSGASSVATSDGGYVNSVAHIGEPEDMLLSYLYEHPVSPHLAAKWEGNPIEKDVIIKDWNRVLEAYPFVTVEGSGGIVCPLRDDDKAFYLLEDIVHWLSLPSILVSHAGLGTINNTVLTAFYMKEKNLPVKGIILNHYTGSLMEKDNIRIIERLTHIPVIATVCDGDEMIDIDPDVLISYYE